MRWLVVALIASRAEAWPVDERESFVRPSSVRARLDRTTAVFDARYGFEVKGPAMFGGAVELPLPPRGVAVGATVAFAGASHRAALMPARDAEAAYDHLATLDGASDRRAAVVLHATTSVITLDIASPRDGHMDVDVTYEVPTCLFRDVRYAAVPAKWPGLRTPDVPIDQIEAACGDAGDRVDHAWVPFAARELAQRAGGASRVGTFADVLDTGVEQIARVEIDLAGQLDAMPGDLATAIVIDGSRSMSPAALDAQRELVESYLRKVPTTRVQIVAYARTARPLLPSWTPASLALPRADRELRALDLRNGSNLDAGLAAAASWLARVRGTHRILVFTDELVAQRLRDMPTAALRKLVSADTLVHVIAVDAGADGLVRDDAALFAALALATTGMPARVGAGEIDATALVRPLSLDNLKLATPGWQPIENLDDGHACRDALGEGMGCAWWGIAGAPGPITVEGWLWGRKVVRVLRPDPTRARTLARELTALGGLDSAIQARVDRHAYAVNAEWSLAATWGGAQGYADVPNTGRGFGTTARCCGDHVPVPTVTIGRARISARDDLRAQLAPAIAACHASDHRVEIDLELTLVEIVGVEVVVVPWLTGDSDLPALHDCIVEAVWDIPLRRISTVDHDMKHVVLGPR